MYVHHNAQAIVERLSKSYYSSDDGSPSDVHHLRKSAHKTPSSSRANRGAQRKSTRSPSPTRGAPSSAERARKSEPESESAADHSQHTWLRAEVLHGQREVRIFLFVCVFVYVCVYISLM
jgi:hypothetical protein